MDLYTRYAITGHKQFGIWLGTGLYMGRPVARSALAST